MKKLITTAAMILGLALASGLPGQVALADSGSATYGFLLGEAPVEGPDVAMAANGDTVSITGTGQLSIHAKSASGSGEFTHRHANGDVVATGTWTVTQLSGFIEYGCQVIGGATICGGHAVLQV